MRGLILDVDNRRRRVFEVRVGCLIAIVSLLHDDDRYGWYDSHFVREVQRGYGFGVVRGLGVSSGFHRRSRGDIP